jgi:hypothetical protein
MTEVTGSQRTAARFVGGAYLLAMPLALFSGLYVPQQLFVTGNAAATARNIVAHERLFRLGVGSDLLAFLVDVVLIAALYTALKPVDRHLALFATFVRLIETSLLVTATVNSLDTLRFLGDADYLKSFAPDQLGALARLAIGAHGTAYGAGLVFAGVGSAVFCWLWLKSGLVPYWLAALGIGASVLLAACTGAFIVFPELAKTLTVAVYGGPIFVFELTMGFWLVFKGVRTRRPGS